jgi:uncharacterized membrane protein
MTPSNLPGTMVRSMRLLSLTLLLALIGLCLAWELWLAPTGSGTLALKVVPLLFCVIGLLRHRMYTYRWLSLLIWLYFLEGTVRATSEGGLGAVLAGLEVLLSLLLFAVATVYIRKRLKSAPASTEAAV